MKSRVTPLSSIFLISSILATLFFPLSPSLALQEKTHWQQSTILAATDPSAYLTRLSKATYLNLKLMVEPITGLPHDQFDAVRFDITPQFAVARKKPYINKDPGASLVSSICKGPGCARSGLYGLRLVYKTPPGTWGSYNIEAWPLDIDDSTHFDVSPATYLEAWVRGAKGGERFEIVLWSDCQGPFPGRPQSAVITAPLTWKRIRIPLKDFIPFGVNLSSLCRLSIGFNDAMSQGGTVYLDQIAFVKTDGTRIHVPLDETTNISNVGFYISDVIGAMHQGWESRASAKAKLSKTLTSLEKLEKSHGFPHTHNHVVSLNPAIVSNKDDRCREDLTGLPAEEPNLFSTVDLGNLAAGLILLRQSIPELAGRAGVLVDAMEWDWLYDGTAGLPYGCRASDGDPSTWWHYDWLAADSRLAHAIGIGAGKIPPDSWNNLKRDKETPLCTTLWHFEPGWDGGGLFMAFMPGIFLDEAGSELGISAKNFMKDQICQAKKIGAPAWGWSATVLPNGEYCGYGRICMDALVPHASILTADYLKPPDLVKNLQALQKLGARPPLIDGAQRKDLGFRASIDWKKVNVAPAYLFLDQSMAFLSLMNKRDHGQIRQDFCKDAVTIQIKALIPRDYANSCQ